MKLRFVKKESQIRLVNDSDNGKCIMVEYWPWTVEQEWCYRKLAEVERKRKAVEASRRWQIERQRYEHQLNEAEQTIETLRKQNQALDDALIQVSSSFCPGSLLNCCYPHHVLYSPRLSLRFRPPSF